jgi:hypothetical protein
MSAQIQFFTMPFSKFPTSGIAGALYYASDLKSLYLCCGSPSAMFPLSGILAGGISLSPVTDANRIVGFDIAPQEGVAPEDGVILQFDATSKTWKQVALPAAGVSKVEATSISIAMAVALG